MKQRHTLLFALPMFIGIGTTAQASGHSPNMGLWSFEVNYDLVGLPQTFPGYNMEQCIHNGMPFPSINRPGHECQMWVQGLFGNTVTWTLNCSDDWEMVQGMGSMHYMGDKARGDVHLQIRNPHNPPQMMVYRIEGKRKGHCGE